MPRPLIGITIHGHDAAHRRELDRLSAQIIAGVERAACPCSSDQA